MQTEYETILVARPHQDVLLLTMNRPEAMNAMNTQMGLDMLDVFATLAAHPDTCRAVVLTGAGDRAFCAGGDLKQRRGMTDAEWQAQHHIFERKVAAMIACPVPVIAAVNGAALAGGCGIATLCDFTLAVPEAKFGYTEVKIGFLPAIVSVFLTRQVGEKRARDLLLTGRMIAAAEARDMGLVSEIVEPDRLHERARELAAVLIEASPSSLTRAKRLMTTAAAAGVDADLERAVLENARIRCTPDFKEGIASFLEKRKPNWHGDAE